MANKLKTLQDLDGVFSNGKGGLGPLHVNESQLVKEAIKWYNRSDDDKHAFIKKFFCITDKQIIDAKVSEDEQ